MIFILYVDDELPLLEVVKLYLERSGQFSVDIISSASSALTQLKTKNYDAIVSDYQMPGMDGIEFLKKVRTSGNTTPFILFTGKGREDIVIQALNEGADYYLQKGGEPKSQFAELTNQIRQAVQKRQNETSLRNFERRESDILNFMPDATFAIDTNGIVIEWNRAMEEITGVKTAEILGKGNYEYSLPFYHERRPIFIDLVLNEDRILESKYPLIKRNGKTIIAETTSPFLYNGKGATVWIIAAPLYDSKGTIVGAIESFRDITDRKRMEETLHATQKNFRAVLDNLPDLVLLHRDGLILYVNPAMMDIMGKRPDEVLNRPILDYIAPEYHQRVITAIQERIKTGWDHPFEIGLLPGSGDQRTVLIRGSMIEFDGSPAILNLLTDITERRKAERALLESEQQYRNVIEDQTEFICRFRPDGTHIFVNEAYCRYFNKKREEILWHRFLPEIPPEDQKSMKQFFESLTPENPVDTIEHRIIMYDGSIRWQRWSDRAIFSENGTIIEYQSVGRDVTEIKKAEEAINLANQKLQLLSEITRHDILNQLTALRTCLLMADDVEKDAEKRDLIQKEQQIAATIEAQIQFTKDYQTVGIKAPAWHNVRESLMRSVRSIPILNVKVEIERADFEILADPLFDKVFSNLIDNSLRHGGAKMDLIRFSCRVNEERLVCSYEDNGVGILPDDKPLVFNRGFGKHTGLGMFLTKEILAITGITITENGEFGNGARFEITVPKGAYRLVDV